MTLVLLYLNPDSGEVSEPVIFEEDTYMPVHYIIDIINNSGDKYKIAFEWFSEYPDEIFLIKSHDYRHVKIDKIYTELDEKWANFVSGHAKAIQLIF